MLYWDFGFVNEGMEHKAREIPARTTTHLGFLGSEYHFMVF
jgi:hypothetical protein